MGRMSDMRRPHVKLYQIIRRRCLADQISETINIFGSINIQMNQDIIAGFSRSLMEKAI
jgi:reverse gyrase